MSRRALLHQRSFVALLAAEVISTTGAQLTWLPLPWFVLVTSGSKQMAFVVAAAGQLTAMSYAALVTIRHLDRERA